MGVLRPSSRVVRVSPAWRGALWRWRHAFLAVALVTAVLLLADALAPVPTGPAVVVLTRDVPAGRDLRAADLEVRPADDGAAPASSFPAVADVAGRRLVVGLPAGTVVSEELVLGPGLAAGAPPGHLVLPISISDPGSRALAQSGRRITLLGGTEMLDSTVLVPEVLVLSVLEDVDTGGFISTGDISTIVIVAVPNSLANVVVDASAQGPLRVAVPSTIP
ncbi:MAG: SAF domain-containing protein [Actinomycetota bacterium]